MLIDKIRPTSIKGVKSLATQLRKENRIKHSVALDLAAKSAGCTNFRNAQHTLLQQGKAATSHYILLTQYWYDKEQRHKVGRETMRIELREPVFNICQKAELRNVRGFAELRMVADDHFVCDSVGPNQAYARGRLCTAERSLRFMEQTGLRPSRDYRKFRPTEDLPNRDHWTYWTDPASGQYILIDEPYEGVPDEAERSDWSNQTGWQVAKTSWPGMYSPYNCDLYIATNGKAGFDFNALVAKINAMPPPLLNDDWSGESSSSWETFVSPMAKTAQDKRRARCRGTIYPVASATTVPCRYAIGASRRRPIGTMGADGHVMAGQIIKALLTSNQSHYGVNNRMNSLRSTLEDWMFSEIDNKQFDDPNPDNFDTYYGSLTRDNPYQEKGASHAGILTLLGNLRKKLEAAYSNSAPLRKQLRRIDMSVELIGKMKVAAS
jgi:hypothetical protein